MFKTKNTSRLSFDSNHHTMDEPQGSESNNSLNSVASDASSMRSPLPRTASEISIKRKGMTRAKSLLLSCFCGPFPVEGGSPMVRRTPMGAAGIGHAHVQPFDRVLDAWVNELDASASEGSEQGKELKCRQEVADQIRAAKISGRDTLTICSQPLSSLPDCIGELSHLNCLNIMDLNLTALPALPQNLKYLSVNKNRLSELPSNLPNSLKFLDVSNNALVRLPVGLPGDLGQFDISKNQITELPKLPETLHHLTISDNRFTDLPSTLPAGMKNLIAENNQIEHIPVTLPTAIRFLNLENNRITQIPENIWALAENDKFYPTSTQAGASVDQDGTHSATRGREMESRTVSLRNNPLDVEHEKAKLGAHLANGKQIPKLFF